MGSVGPELRTLFEAGTVAGCSDGELIDRFLTVGGPAAELAFAALVERHGPMVWRVCRDVLRESNDADDAFQATFLVLVRNGVAIRKRSSLGPWLYGVALRVARAARRGAGLRRGREQVAAKSEREEAMADVDRLDAGPILHEEIGRLPEKFRSPLVLCYFEGLTHDQAASRLGWPVGTVRSRLAEARDRLRPRLVTRGLAPSVAILAATGSGEAATTMPAALIAATIKMAVGAGETGVVPVAVAALVGTTLREMTLMKTLMIAAGLVTAILAGTAGVGYVAVAARPQDAGKTAAPQQDDRIPKADAAQPDRAAIDPTVERNTLTSPVIRAGVNSPRVLWARLNAAAKTYKILDAQHKAAQIGYAQVSAARGELETIAAELSDCIDDLNDEIDLLKIRLEIKRADVQALQIQLAGFREVHGSPEDLARSNANGLGGLRGSRTNIALHEAELLKKQGELNEVVLRIKQATRRRDEAITYDKRAKELVPEHEARLAPGAPTTKQ